MPVAHLLNKGLALPDDFMGFSLPDPDDFDAFCQLATEKITTLLPATIDARKRNLFQLIFAQQGEINVQALSEKIAWPPRQINAYFNRQLGLPLKAYCNILRFQASLQYIREGKLYPQLNYTDQSHFIKEVKKLSGVSPKELRKNEHNRFLQFLVEVKK
jgi:AraC-like DNA-binding protein